MRFLKTALLILVLAPVSLLIAQSPPAEQSPAAAQMPSASTMDQVVDRIISREQAVVASLRDHTPLAETYIQMLKPDKELGSVPNGDKYFLGRAQLRDGLELRSLTERTGKMRRLFGGFGSFFSPSLQFLPHGFLQMVFIDMDGFDRQHYKFDYVRREFLGEVRCLVFDVIPLPKSGKGRFTGRIWVEDQDYTIVRFNGKYGQSGRSSYYFHFDSWRVNAGPGLWLPAYVYSEETDLSYALWRRMNFKAQTRLWGYNLGPAGREQELSKILVEAATPVQDTADAAKDYSPLQAQRAWDRQAEENVVERLERIGLIGPRGEVEKVLETVVNNLQVTNNLDIQPEVRCRVLLTSTLESFTLGNTIVLSRGLIDTLPDEASLATMIGHELSHIVLGHRISGKYAFNDRLLFKDEETFQHFGFARTEAEEQAANQKGVELLKNSPYKDSLGNAARFLKVLHTRGEQIPNLISAHLGNRVALTAETLGVPPADATGPQIAALPLGGRIKMDAWSGATQMMKSKPVGAIAEREKMPFEVTPFMIYLTRQTPAQGQTAVSATTKPDEAQKQQ